MNAEFGIDDEGRAYVSLNGLTPSEWNMMRRLKAFLPVQCNDWDGEVRIRGDRLPGMGSVKAQDATSKAV